MHDDSPQPGAGAVPDPHTRRMLAALEEAGVAPMHELGPAGARQAMLDGRVNEADPPAVARIEDLAMDGPGGRLALRCYRPPAPQGTPGALLYFHGGGFVIGDLDTHDTICRHLCALGGVAVVSVDYRLAPEHPFPAAVDDALAALAWLRGQAGAIGADPGRLAVAGDSAGGTLAAVAAQRARDDGVALCAQLLLYPVVDLAGRYPSHAEHRDTPPIAAPVLDWFWSLYLGPQRDAALLRDPRVSPLHAPRFDGLAPAFVLTAGLDPLRDEGAAYAHRLAGAGVETLYQCALGTVHGFLRQGRLIPAAGDAMRAAGAFLAARMERASP